MTATIVSTGAAWPLAAGRRPADGADEHALAARAKGGDHDAFEVLVRRHGRYVYNLAHVTLGDPHEAEDAAQETFVRAWRALSGFRAESQLRTWLYRIVVNVCYDRLPRLRQDVARIDGGDDDEESALRRRRLARRSRPVDRSWRRRCGRPSMRCRAATGCC
ncbi:MAG: sigma-70 family RNA polymerase sigma factor [Anaerolineae bacterium]